jgi:hypothetical protein
MELDEDAELLKYLPYQRGTFQPQNELPGAAPDRLLYGDMMEEKDQLWVYFTLLGGGQNYNRETGGNRMLSFYTLKAAQNGGAPIRVSKIQELALSSSTFKQARDIFQIMVWPELCGQVRRILISSGDRQVLLHQARRRPKSYDAYLCRQLQR